MIKQTKSKVNQAGNYTKPTMRKSLFNKIKAGTKGGDPGSGRLEKHNYLLFNIKKKEEDTNERCKSL